MLNEPQNTTSPRLSRLNERRRSESVVIDRRKTYTKHTRRHDITTVRQPERKEAAGSGGDRSQMAYKAHLGKKTVSPRFGGLYIVGQAGPMAVRETSAHGNIRETKSEAGSKVDGLWTAKSRHAEKP